MLLTNRLKNIIVFPVLLLVIFSVIGLLTFKVDAAAEERLVDIVDQFIQENMEQKHVPGLVISVVKDGELILKKGFGYADLEKNIEVDPNQTLFRIESVSQLFVATSVIQLAEEGKLKLNDDINQHLKSFKFPETYAEPIRVFDLLHHTTGFDERIIGTAVRDFHNRIELKEYLAENMPARIRKPGQVAQYSHYGMALAGYLVEETTGQSYADYLKQHIFNPLNMNSSYPFTTEENIGQLAKEYNYFAGQLESLPRIEYHAYPARSVLTTAADMAKFMNAHLSQADNILDSQFLTQMHTSFLDKPEGAFGYTHGFSESFQNGQRYLGANGGGLGFGAATKLDLENNIGVFVAANGPDFITASSISERLVNRVLKYYSGDEAKQIVPKANKLTLGNLEDYAGFYRSINHPHQSVAKLFMILSSPDRNIQVVDQKLKFENQEYQPIGEAVFQSNTGDLIYFKEYNDQLFLNPAGGSYQKIPRYESLLIHAVLLIFFIFIFFMIFLIKGLTPLFRFIFRKEVKSDFLEILIAVASLLAVVFLSSWILYPLLGLENILFIIFGLPTVMNYLLYLPPIFSLLTIISVVIWYRRRKEKRTGGSKFIIFSFFASAFGYLIILKYYNLL